MLVEPTVAEVAAGVGARALVGDPAALDRDVRAVVVGAATLPTVLEHLTDGVLVITPGDRADVALGVLAAAASASAPRVSGLLLCTGLLPDPRVQRILDGLAYAPVLAVDTDTFTTAQAVGRVQGHLTARSTRKITAALGSVERHVDVEELARRVELTRSTRVTPLMFSYDLVERARADRRRIVLPEGTDERILRAAEIVLRRGVAGLTLLGRPDEIHGRAAALGLDLTGAAVLDPAALEADELRERFAATYAKAREHKGVTLQQARDIVTDVSYFGTLMVHEELADGMVSGALHTTAHTIRPAFEVIRTVPGVRTVSSVFFMCLPDRVLVYGDCAIIPDPDAGQLADIAVSAAATARRFGVDPRVAMLSYSTGESGSGADVDKVREATRLVREREPLLPVEGPIQYDAAVDASVARTKLPGSEVAGQATVFVFPDLNTGNNTYKAVQRSAGAIAVGPVLQGLRRPVNDLSRGCTVADIVDTVAITAIQAQPADRPIAADLAVDCFSACRTAWSRSAGVSGRRSGEQQPAAGGERAEGEQAEEGDPAGRGHAGEPGELVRVGAAGPAPAAFPPQLGHRPHRTDEQEPRRRVPEGRLQVRRRVQRHATTTAPVSSSDSAPYALRTITSMASSTAEAAHSMTVTCSAASRPTPARPTSDGLR